jgi:enamine deaminase RidA (YjgF/YER057c/UK114 family)
MKRTNYSSNTKWENEVGYSRAVKLGCNIYVSGTTAADENGNIIGIGDVYKQTIYILKKIENSLLQLDSKMSDVVRTRMYITNIELWEEAGRAHGEYFREIKPASTMVEVSSLISPDLLIEIEADAITNE